MSTSGWKSVRLSPPKDGVFVRTKIDDANGCRNVQMMKKSGNLWFVRDGSYVYYTPTHWQEV